MRMPMPFGAGFAASLCLASLGLGASSAHAANPIQKECSQKYQAAKASNTLNGMKYNEYYKQCAAAAKAAPAPAAPAAPTPTTAPAAPAPAAPTTTTAARPVAPSSPTAVGGVVFPTALSPQFASESAGKGRMHTCLAQYNANKANNGTGNGALKWIMKGGGYYSECNKRLKS